MEFRESIEKSSDMIYIGNGCESNAFSFSTILQPFSSVQASDSDAIINRSPICCLYCASYYNHYCKLSSDNNQRWECCICNYINPPLFPSSNILSKPEIYDLFPELKFDHVDYVETNNTLNQIPIPTVNTSSKNFIYLLAIDINLCKELSFFEFIEESFQNLPDKASISIVILGATSNYILRLITMNDLEPMCFDALPLDDSSGFYISLFLRSGQHVAPIDKVKENIYAIVNSIVKISSLNNYNHDGCQNKQFSRFYLGASLCSIVGLSMALSYTAPSGPGIRLVLITSKPIKLGDISKSTLKLIERLRAASSLGTNNFNNNRGVEALNIHEKDKSYLDPSVLGLLSVSGGCWADVFILSSFSLEDVLCLDSFAGSTGGIVVQADSFNDTAWKKTLYASLSKLPLEFTPKGQPVCVEIRLCESLKADHIIGPIINDKDYKLITGKDILSASVDEAHLRFSYEQAKINIKSIAKENFSQLSPHIDMISNTNPPNSKDPNISLFNRLSSYISPTNDSFKNLDQDIYNDQETLVNVMKRISNGSDSFKELYATCRSDSKTSISSQFSYKHNAKNRASNNDSVYLQFIVRMEGILPCERLRYERSPYEEVHPKKITRVWTIRIPISYEIPQYLRSLNETIWSVSIAQSVVADYHTELISRPKQELRKNRSNPSSKSINPTEFSDCIDRLIKDICAHWYVGGFNFDASSSEKIINTCKMLYFLRQGPFIGGQLLDDCSSYLLRSYFLCNSLSYFLSILKPKLLLHVSPFNLSTDELDLLSVECDAISTFFFPFTFITLDVGDAIYIWEGSEAYTNIINYLDNDVHNNNNNNNNNDKTDNKMDIYKKIQSNLLNAANFIADQRYPVPSIKYIKGSSIESCLSFDERFIYARLFPARHDVHEIDMYHLADFCTKLENIHMSKSNIYNLCKKIDKSCLDNLKNRAPYTDEPSFMSYISNKAPKIFDFLKNLGKINLLKFPELNQNLSSQYSDVFNSPVYPVKPVDSIERNLFYPTAFNQLV